MSCAGTDRRVVHVFGEAFARSCCFLLSADSSGQMRECFLGSSCTLGRSLCALWSASLMF